MTAVPDYVVIRPHPDLPAGFLPADLDGKWFDRTAMPVSRGGPVPDHGYTVGEAVAVPTGRFEVRGDGAVAEVWEIRP